MKRILQVVPELNMGGVEIGTIHTSLAIQKNINMVSYVASNGGEKVKILENNNIKHFTFFFKYKNPFIILINTIYLILLIFFKKIDIVHARSRSCAWSSWLACKITNTKFITTFHGYYSGYNHIIKNKYNSVMTYGEKVIVSTRFMKEHLIKYYKVDENRITIIPRGIETEKYININSIDMEKFKKKYRISNNFKYIITLPARLTEWKGQKLLIEAANIIKRNDYLYILSGTGSITYKNQLINLISKYNLKNFRIIENCDNISVLYNISNIIISASNREESFGRVVVEAQASGCNVIASNIGGSCETIINNKTGILFESNNYNDLANKIKYIINNNISYKNEAIINSKKYNLGVFNKNVINFYNSL